MDNFLLNLRPEYFCTRPSLPFHARSVISALIAHLELLCLFGFCQKQRLWVETETQNKPLICGKGTYITCVFTERSRMANSRMESRWPEVMLCGQLRGIYCSSLKSWAQLANICGAKKMKNVSHLVSYFTHMSTEMIYYYCYCILTCNGGFYSLGGVSEDFPSKEGNPDENTK